MQKNENRRNEKKRNFYAGKESGKSAGQGVKGGRRAGGEQAEKRTYGAKAKLTQETGKSGQDIYRTKNAQKPGNSRNMNTDSKGKSGRGAQQDQNTKSQDTKKKSLCPVSRRCGGCQFLDIPYEKQLQHKQKQVEDLLKGICPVKKITGMENPFYYRNKVHAAFGYQKGKAISGVYEEGTHEIVPVEQCMIEDKKADEIIGTIRGMLKSFKIKTYDEDTGYGLLRHVLVKRGFATNQVMVVLVTASPVFPSRNNFVKALREKHPEITTIIQNINDRGTSMVLGDREKVLYGKGYIEDVLCGYTFRISSKSFYQINPVQTEKLYAKAIELAGLTGKETVIDAYCGIGTIGMVASAKAKTVIGVELNQDAVRDAVENAKTNQVKNIQFYNNDAGRFMVNMAANGEHVDVVLMDPPRSGSTEEFIKSVAIMKPERVVYVSCNPETLERDLRVFKTKGYVAKEAWPFDLFPHTGHTETVVIMQYCGKEKKSRTRSQDSRWQKLE